MSQELEGTLTNTANLVGTFGSEGGGGTSNYNDLINKPSINSVTLQGNKTASQLGFAEVATSGNYNDLSNKPTLAAVATSGDYDDLTNKPSIPAAQVNSDWNASSGVAEILNKPTLSAVATSGDYDDLTNKPTIPAAQVNSDWNATSGVSEILNKPTVYQNAADLPISANDSTDTKTYIDGHVKGWTSLGTLSDGGTVNIAGYTELLVYASVSTVKIGGVLVPIVAIGSDYRVSFIEPTNTSMYISGKLSVASDILTYTKISASGWGTDKIGIYAR